MKLRQAKKLTERVIWFWCTGIAEPHRVATMRAALSLLKRKRLVHEEVIVWRK